MATDIVQAILAVFGDISEWIIQALLDLTGLFWSANGTGEGFSLTFFGVMAVVGLGISVIFLLIRVIQNFLHLRS